MSGILELPEVRARMGLLTVEAYETLSGMGAVAKRAELIRGVIINKMPKSPLHRRLSKLIYSIFLLLERSGFVAFTESPLRLKDSMPEPDVMLVCGEVKDFDVEHPTTAELVVEVAVSSVALDRANCSLYAEANVPEYWIIVAEERHIEVYRQPTGGRYMQKRVYSLEESLVCESVPGVQVIVADLFT